MKINLVNDEGKPRFDVVSVWRIGDSQREAKLVKEAADVITWCVENLHDCSITDTIVSRIDFTYSAKARTKVREQVSECRSTLRVEPASYDDVKAFSLQWYKRQTAADQNYTI